MPKFEELGSYVETVWKTQAALAKQLGVAQNTVSNWINGKLRVTLEYQKALRELEPPYEGPFPEAGAEFTSAEVESLRQEIRTQAGWLREEARKESTALAAVLQEVLKRLGPPKGS